MCSNIMMAYVRHKVIVVDNLVVFLFLTLKEVINSNLLQLFLKLKKKMH